MNRHLFVAVLWLGVGLLSLLGAGASEQSATTTPQLYLPVVSSLHPPPPPPLPAPDDVVAMDDLLDLDAVIGSAVLPAGSAHSYTVEVVSEKSWSVTVIAAADIVLTVWLDGVLLVDRQNLAPARAAEVVGLAALMEPGVYEIWVMTQSQAETEYAIAQAAWYTESDITFSGFLQPGRVVEPILAGQDEQQTWFYEGIAGQTVRLHLETGPANDGLFHVYGPGAEYLETMDDNFWGEPETYVFELPATGLYAFAIADIDYAPMVYSFELTVE